MRFSPKNYSTAAVLGTGGLLANLLVFHTPLLGIPCLAVIIFLWTLLLERYVRAATDKAHLRSFANALLFCVAAYISISTMIYVVWKIDTIILCVLVVANCVLYIFFLHKKTLILPTFVRNREMLVPRQAWVFLITGILSLVAAWMTLLGSGSSAALRSPWESVPLRFLVLLGTATVSVFLLAQNKRTVRYATILGLFVVATSLFVAAVVYRLGYGFDPFIHEAAMREIVAHGVVFPKTPYYLGA